MTSTTPLSITRTLQRAEDGDTIGVALGDVPEGSDIPKVSHYDYMGKEDVEDGAIMFLSSPRGQLDIKVAEPEPHEFEVDALFDAGAVDVDAVVNFDDNEMPDMHLDAFADHADAEVAAVEDAIETTIDDVEGIIRELEQVREAYRRVLDREMTLDEFERRVDRLALENGGELQLDEGISSPGM